MKQYNFYLVFNNEGFLDSIYREKDAKEAHNRLLFLNFGEKVKGYGVCQKNDVEAIRGNERVDG